MRERLDPVEHVEVALPLEHDLLEQVGLEGVAAHGEAPALAALDQTGHQLLAGRDHGGDLVGREHPLAHDVAVALHLLLLRWVEVVVHQVSSGALEARESVTTSMRVLCS